MNNKSLKHILLACCFFLSIISCSNHTSNEKLNQENNGNPNQTDNKNLDQKNDKSANNGSNNTKDVTVLCRCKKGSISWSGLDRKSVENKARKNCASINGSAQDCKVIN